MSEVQQLKTLIHEIAHAKLHNILKEKSTELTPEEQKNNRTMEVEAVSGLPSQPIIGLFVAGFIFSICFFVLYEDGAIILIPRSPRFTVRL